MTLHPQAFAGIEENVKELAIHDCLRADAVPPAIRTLKNLELLDLESAGLKSLRAQDLAGLDKLTNLSLANNDLSTLEEGSLSQLPSLKNLFLGPRNLLDASLFDEA